MDQSSSDALNNPSVNAEEAKLPPGFEVLKLIGEGNFGKVYKALYQPLSRTVAVKVVKIDETSDGEKRIERFKREAQALAKLDHPNIVKIFQIGTCKNGAPFLACEYIDGKTLSTYLKMKGTLSISECSQVFLPLVDALAYAHSQGLVHRDIKPGNIMIVDSFGSFTYKVKLLDFGIARDTTSTQGQGADLTSALLGSPLYMSPEQCKNEKIDGRSDFYSLACVLFECIYRHTPFEADAPYLIMYKHLNDAPEASLADEERRQFMDDPLGKFLSKCLSKNQEDRPSDCNSFKAELKSALSKTKLGGTAKRSFSGKIAAAAIACIVLLLGAALIFKSINSTTSRKKGTALATYNLKTRTQKITLGTSSSRLDWAAKTLVETDLHEFNENLYRDALNLLQPESDFEKPGTPRTYQFSYWAVKSQLFNRLGMWDDERKALLKALEISRNANNSHKRDAVFIYLHLANISKPDEAEQWIKQAKILEQQYNDGEGHIQTLDIPQNLNVEDRSHAMVKIIEQEARVAYARHKYEECLRLLRQAESDIGIEGDLFTDPFKRQEASVLIDMGRRKEAEKLISDYEAFVDSCPDIALDEHKANLLAEVIDMHRKPNVLRKLGDWAVDRHLYQFAVRCFVDGSRACMGRPENREDYEHMQRALKQAQSSLAEDKMKLTNGHDKKAVDQ